MAIMEIIYFCTLFSLIVIILEGYCLAYVLLKNTYS